MLNFQLIRVEDRARIESYTRNCGKQNCDIAFFNCYCYYRGEWCEHEGVLLIRVRVGAQERLGYMEPLGAVDPEVVLPWLEEDAHAQGEPLRLLYLSAAFVERVRQSSWGGRCLFYANRDQADYIYTSESLSTLHGKHLQAKRNHVNQFKRRYTYHVEPLSVAQVPQMLEVLKQWDAGHDVGERPVQIEQEALDCSLSQFEALQLQGIGLYVEDRMVAFTFGTAINDHTFDVHIEKADITYEGAYTMVNQQFAELLSPQYTYLNREDDLGVEGLRQAKLSYHPEQIYAKWFSLEIPSAEGDVWRLWREGFGTDDDAFIASYLEGFYSEQTTLWGENPKGERVCMVHLHAFTNRFGRLAYVYALATQADHRCQGYAEEVMCRALQQAYAEGAILAVTIAQNPPVAAWYRAHLDFVAGQATPLRFRGVDGFDFGTGDPQKDQGLYRPVNVPAYLAEVARLHPELEETLEVWDPLLSENSGCYRVSHGAVTMERRGVVAHGLTPGALFARYPLEDP
ncbi:MAG: GNAT family N-acetyltransferase, partial [Alistipes sp.]|nr:GNAT family N-acetyltransferase [Alistipes sp.]